MERLQRWTVRSAVLLLGLWGCGAPESAGLPAEFESAFPELTATHFYSVPRADQPAGHPFGGNPIDTSFHFLFDDDDAYGLFAPFGYYAAGRPVDAPASWFILRGPGRTGSTDLILFRAVEGQLRRAVTLTQFWENARTRLQQDAWLTDLNGDGRLDIVTRMVQTSAQGATEQEKVRAILQQPDGSLQLALNTPVDPAAYPLADLD